ncbi:hypothetical protein EFN45_02940 [Leuconostoc citreum]|uniref:hypothetical protein n=1 Tax=Leuconostoc citreum TaxID=33964 RepID=UPI0021A6FE75|nr:hypothetical protein [Leuconostoc citreum]MCT3069057.1 hypothetical protein [Leuconostoc citreum]
MRELLNNYTMHFVEVTKQHVSYWFINSEMELIIFQEDNVFINLDGIESKKDMIMRALHCLSRDTFSLSNVHKQNQILAILNEYIGLNYGKSEYKTIYRYLGNGINPKMTSGFIEAGYDMSYLDPESLF